MSLLLRLLKARYRRSAQLYRKPFVNQDQLLERILRDNAGCSYGKLHGFSEITTIEQYREQVPVVDYDAIEPWIERICRGESRVLTFEPVQLLEPTGGSSGSQKLIPYTATLRRDFQRSIEAWLYGLFTQEPALLGGKSYWMISPPLHEKRYSIGGIPIGFEEDAQYLGALGARLMKQVMVKPDIHAGMSTEAFYEETLRALLEAEDLRLISVWNPSLLRQLVEHLWVQLPRVLDKLSRKRRMAIRRALFTHDLQSVWPELRLISCWMDGSAAAEAERLKQDFPWVTFQAKGLLATEAIISFPTDRSKGAAGLPAWHSTYFEFRQGDSFYGLEELSLHETYEVIITTSGGLYRYALGDVVRVEAFDRNVPLLRFVERTQTVDLAGEKLSAGFIDRQFAWLKGFYLFVPRTRGYRLYTDRAVHPHKIEQTLRSNYHYALARDLGQLEHVQVFVIEGDAEAQYLDNLNSRGMRLGDIKSAHLSTRQDWTFKGEDI